MCMQGGAWLIQVRFQTRLECKRCGATGEEDADDFKEKDIMSSDAAAKG